METKTALYHTAFRQFLRKGTPMYRTLKADHPTPYYVWRTRGDSLVRASHARNEGHVFLWDAPPPTGNPGEEYGCRCWAEPYVRGKTEFAYQTLISPIIDSSKKWVWYDFVRHALDEGTDVTLSQIGQLQDVINYYAYVIEGGVFARVTQQIIDEARRSQSGYFTYFFSNNYSFEAISYPHGKSSVYRIFKGYVSKDLNNLVISGNVNYFFGDEYTDPVDIRQIFNGTSNPEAVSEMWRQISDGGGKIYKITGEWETELFAEVKADEDTSNY